MGNFLNEFLNISVFPLLLYKKIKETKRTNVIKFAHFSLKVKSKVHLIKGFDYDTSLLLPADTFFPCSLKYG